MWDLNVFDRFKATATAGGGGGSKMCARSFMPNLAPSILQRSQWHFADTYLGWSCSAVQFQPNCSRFCEMAAILIFLKNHFFHFYPIIFWLFQWLWKFGRDINFAWGKGHLAWEFDLKWPWPWELAAILKVWICIFLDK